MKNAFRASRLMGLLMLALGLAAFGATAAQAEPGAEWKVNKTTVTDALNAQLQASIENLNGVKHGILLTKVGLSTVEILCTEVKFVDALLKILGGAKGKIHFEGCITKLNGATAAACKPHSPGAAEGLIETNKLDGLIKLHTPAAGAKVDLFELLPEKVGEVTPPFVTLVMGKEVGSECAIGAKFDITGPAFLKDFQEEGLVEKVTHLVVEGPLTALKFGANAAKIDGNVNVFLTGATHVGMTFSGIAK